MKTYNVQIQYTGNGTYYVENIRAVLPSIVNSEVSEEVLQARLEAHARHALTQNGVNADDAFYDCSIFLSEVE